MEVRVVAKTLVDRSSLCGLLAIDSKASTQDLFSGLGVERDSYLDHIFVTVSIAGYNTLLTARPSSMRSRFYPRRGVWLLTGSLSEFRELVYAYLLTKTQDNDLNSSLAREIYNLFLSDPDLKSVFSRVRREDRSDGFYLVSKS